VPTPIPTATPTLAQEPVLASAQTPTPSVDESTTKLASSRPDNIATPSELPSPEDLPLTEDEPPSANSPASLFRPTLRTAQDPSRFEITDEPHAQVPQYGQYPQQQYQPQYQQPQQQYQPQRDESEYEMSPEHVNAMLMLNQSAGWPSSVRQGSPPLGQGEDSSREIDPTTLGRNAGNSRHLHYTKTPTWAQHLQRPQAPARHAVVIPGDAYRAPSYVLVSSENDNGRIYTLGNEAWCYCGRCDAMFRAGGPGDIICPHFTV
jgi:hypothetical protein